MTTQPELDVALPAGWYCKSMSPSGYGVYEKWVRSKPLRSGYEPRLVYRVSFNGFAGGWCCYKEDRLGGLGPAVQGAFPTYIGAIVAIEIELSNNNP